MLFTYRFHLHFIDFCLAKIETCLGFSGFESGFSSPVTEEFWQWVGAGVSGSIQVSFKEIASVGHEAEFRSWCGTLGY